MKAFVDRSGAVPFVAWGLGAAVPPAVLLGAVIAAQWPSVLGWALGGWAATTALGVAGGAWLTTLHGNPSPAFLAALLACMLSRLGTALAGGVAAFLAGGRGAAWAWIAGLAAGYVPQQVFETIWFIRRSARQAG